MTILYTSRNKQDELETIAKLHSNIHSLMLAKVRLIRKSPNAHQVMSICEKQNLLCDPQIDAFIAVLQLVFENGYNSRRMSLVNVQTVIPNVQIDLKYATADNFTGQAVYESLECFLHQDVAIQLAAVQRELEMMGLGLKIWDGFRPMAVQWKFWELVSDERYVSDPRKGGRHTRGTAVDVTLVDHEGIELEMPSAFDDFSEKAHRDFMNASSQSIRNRELLENVMKKHGFVGLPSEWWHFDFVGWQNYPSIDSRYEFFIDSNNWENKR